MAKQMTTDQIIEQIGGLREIIRKELLADILIDLGDAAAQGPAHEMKGIQAAIEIITENY